MRESSWSTTVAPMFAGRNVVHCAATCIIGDVGNQTPAPVSARVNSPKNDDATILHSEGPVLVAQGMPL